MGNGSVTSCPQPPAASWEVLRTCSGSVRVFRPLWLWLDAWHISRVFVDLAEGG